MSNLSRTSSQHTTDQATSATVDASTVTRDCVATVNTKHGNVVVRSIKTSDGRWHHIIPSHSTLGATHSVTVERNLFPLQGTCTCPARTTCWHILAANDAENWLGESLWHIAGLMRQSSSSVDYHWGADLLRRLTWTPTTESGVA